MTARGVVPELDLLAEYYHHLMRDQRSAAERDSAPEPRFCLRARRRARGAAMTARGVVAELDLLAEYYHHLMRDQRSAAERDSAPEPRFCLRARPGSDPDPNPSLQDSSGRPLFVNVYGWKRVPAPRSPSHPVPVCAGRVHEVSGEAEHYSIMDVAYNPEVLQKAQEDQAELDQLIRLTLKFIEECYNLTLSDACHIAPFKLKGSLQRMRESLIRGQIPELSLQEQARNDGKGLTLDQLIHRAKAEESHDAMLLLKEEVMQSQVPLIEEIASTEVPEELRAPVYELTVVPDANKKPIKIELKVELPKVSSVSECDLSISKDDLVIDVPEKYRLQLDLPELINEEAATATFNKGKCVLLITMPVLQTEC
ncbi:PREDICTED: PIH1 domain-containing protein 2 [Gavialis gangeticus]|uniref:PIH1 domain-containing protein 2 n=1 Tax=Gavialis gangeticus TaxID=94835 RepID=UPI00092E4D25|nr:PREDICTED: PIH1 domain-containing protein 2 [Gavialis gangeticus]